MQFQSLVLLMFAAVLVMGQEKQSQFGSQRQLAASRPRRLAGSARQPTISKQKQQLIDIELPNRAPALSKPVRPQSSRTSVEAEQRPKKPSVETIRLNPTQRDGSFTFGYENADGSFKEETRGADCVVRGRYGYIERDGTRREFTYQTGNLCDTNDIPALEDEFVVRAQAIRPVSIPRPVISRPVSRLEPARAQPERTQPELLADERQLITEENERRRLHPGVGFALVPQSDPPQVPRFIVEEQLAGQFQQ